MLRRGLVLCVLAIAMLPRAVHAADVAEAPAALQTADALRERIEKLGWELCEKHQVPGVAVAVVRAGALAWVQGCGWADQEQNTEVTAETVFNIGSISKTVAAWGVMKLVEDGKLALDTPVAPKGWQLPASEFDGKGVTLRRMLSHTAGLSLHGYPGFWPPASVPTLLASLGGDTNGAGAVHIEFEPGTRWQYSGGGYTIAQLLVEEASGRPFAEFMQASVLVPLGMTRSAYGWTPEVLAASATPYDENGVALPRGGPCFAELAAAGFQTTAGDLAQFACAGMAHFRASDAPRVLKPETIELMESPAAPATDWGLGYDVRTERGLRLVGHGGANQGWMARLTLAPDSGDALVILTNGSNGNQLIGPLETLWIDSVAEAVAARGARDASTPR